MVVQRKYGKDYINQSLGQIDSNTWLIGSLVLCRSPYLSEKATWNDDGDNSSYTLTAAPTPYYLTTSPPNSPFIKLVHEAGDASAVWSIGNCALCKVRYIEEGVTPELVTLDFVQDQHPSFDTPKVIHHAFGQTLDKAWPSLSEEWRLYYVNAVVNICKEMAEWKGNNISGVDNQNVPEYYLQPQGAKNFSSLQATCEAISIDCSTFVFYYADLGPTNIIVKEEPILGRVGIIDFKIAGYFPQGWIRTKFRLSSGMDLPTSATSNPKWWRSEIQKALGENGFEDFAEDWMRWSAP
ncbi:hypothetical protein K505DRAFT_394109 [Melanomma pulvis-pyrius CBS 109.77]|uniref:Aminoglycoside phosphotransferase domain-containing protein n=1 Tax=Melanomma pulvis-pyrius CBS 109.77 TaxID=1314802 RepID=A0A6A6WY78_9PLEO|nr:hypothetical protein K505DRAFT_394109 [Melanomma pulvis-pyrius CBS 109.77]